VQLVGPSPTQGEHTRCLKEDTVRGVTEFSNAQRRCNCLQTNTVLNIMITTAAREEQAEASPDSSVASMSMT